MKNQKRSLKAVIIAAGMGSRIKYKTNNTPKTLLPFGSETILSTILKNISECGISDFGIVIGYQSQHIEDYLSNNNFFGLNISFIRNNEWERGNGISVLRAEEFSAGYDFILSMSDHIVNSAAIRRIADSALTANLLLVDPGVESVYDIDDATKVKTDGNQIVDIGKEITNYNGIDCGIFRLNARFFDAMRQALKNNQESISAAVKTLIQNQDMQAVFTAEDDTWIDIDTEQAYQYAIEQLREKRS